MVVKNVDSEIGKTYVNVPAGPIEPQCSHLENEDDTYNSVSGKGWNRTFGILGTLSSQSIGNIYKNINNNYYYYYIP